MVTFCCDNKETIKPVIINNGLGKVNIGTITNMLQVWHGVISDRSGDRSWIWFPLLMEPEIFGKTLAHAWTKVYPRVIQWTDGKYYTFRGTHSSNPEYGINGDNTVFYREILVEKGEKVEYYG
jgi:hypothetical protein